MAATYEPIATTTLGSAASTITFSSIPATYTDLRLVIVPKIDNVANSYGQIRLNSDTGTNYSWTYLIGNGSAASSTRGTNNNQNYFTAGDPVSSSQPGLFTVDFFSYAGSTNKTSLVKASIDKNGSGTAGVLVQLWRSTSAIDTILLFFATAAQFQSGTVATLFGIKAA